MQSKREKFLAAAQALGCLQCVVCGEPLTRQGDDFACARGHRVNVNRRGCMNLLSRAVDGCYDAELFEARQRVLRSGCYLPVADAMDSMLTGLRPDAAHRLLDAGCGEGWYLSELLSRHEGWQGAGVDISRDAILRATNQRCTALWCVADLRRLPFADASFTCVLDVLTPAAYQEFGRVLTEDGVLIKVYPGEKYLQELRLARGVALYEEGKVDAYLRKHGTVLRQTRVTVTQPVTPALWRDFVYMTPLNQNLDAKEKQALASCPSAKVTIDLHVAAAVLNCHSI